MTPALDIITSQLPIAMWHEAMGEPTVADAVLDRVLAHLHRIELVGESMRGPEGETKAGAGGERRGRTGAKAAGIAATHDAGGEAPR